MKKAKIIFNFIIVVSLIGVCYSLMFFLFNDKIIMSKDEGMTRYYSILEEDFSNTLSIVGNIATYYDKYGKDENAVVPDSDFTIKQLMEMYDKEQIESTYAMGDYNYIYSDYGYEADGLYESYLDYSDDYNVQMFIDNNPNYTTRQSKAIFDFYCNYSLYKSSLKALNDIDDNIAYNIKYTDVDGQLVQYSTDDADKVLNNKDYSLYYLYDQANDIKVTTLDPKYFHADIYNSKCKTMNDYDDFYVLMAVNTAYPYNTNLSYYVNKVVTDDKSIMEYNMMIILLGMSGIILGFSVIGLAVVTGKNKWHEPARIYAIDRIWWDLTTVIAFLVVLACWIVIKELCRLNTVDGVKDSILKLVCSIAIIIAAEIGIQFVMSIIRRLKCKSLLKTSLIGRIIKKCEVFWSNTSLFLKVAGIAIVFIVMSLVQIFVGAAFYSEFMMILCVIFEAALIFAVCWKFFEEYEEVKEETDKIAEGNIDNVIDRRFKFTINRKMADSVNNIGKGISKAVASSVKNERMKSDLITNVSHDIKTPLTSIINYVNLLRQEDIENENAKNYIKVLDEKSNRLKILVDDLVEASKLSSGTIKLNKTKINLTELVKQSLGEYEEKFNDKRLVIITNFPETEVYINADGRKIWRLLENLYGNIYKYALPGTRVYIDINIIGSKVRIEIKNISENPLNFNSDELTERFIRGDVSRSTEGSGLGLSIAESIVEKHGGVFDIVLDGDLFKVIFSLDLIK